MCGNAFANENAECYLGDANGCASEHNGKNHTISNITQDQWKQYVNDYNNPKDEDGNSIVNPFQIVSINEKEDKEGYVTWAVKHDCKYVEIIKVRYNKDLTDYEKLQKIGKPNIPGSTPETGDASTLMLLGTVALSVAGLFILRDKKDEE
jgi:hypothetical protein